MSEANAVQPVGDVEFFDLARASARKRARLLEDADAAGILLAEMYSDKTRTGRSKKSLVSETRDRGIKYAARSVRNLASTVVWSAEVAEAEARGSGYWCRGRVLPEHVNKFTKKSSKCVCGLVRFLTGAKYDADRFGVPTMVWCGSPEVLREFGRLKDMERASLARVFEDRIVADAGTTERSDFDNAFNHLVGNLNIASVERMVRSYDQLVEDGGDIVVTEVDLADLVDEETGEIDFAGQFRMTAVEGAADELG